MYCQSARRNSISNLTFWGFKSELQTNPIPLHLESLWDTTWMPHINVRWTEIKNSEGGYQLWCGSKPSVDQSSWNFGTSVTLRTFQRPCLIVYVMCKICKFDLGPRRDRRLSHVGRHELTGPRAKWKLKVKLWPVVAVSSIKDSSSAAFGVTPKIFSTSVSSLKRLHRHNKCLSNAKRPCNCSLLCLRWRSLCSCAHTISDMTSFDCRDQGRDSALNVNVKKLKKRG